MPEKGKKIGSKARLVGWIILAVMVISALVYLYYTPLQVPARLVRLGETLINRTLGTRVVFKQVRVSLFHPRVIIQGLEIPEIRISSLPARGWLEVEEAVLEPDPMQIFWGKLSFGRVTLTAPQLWLKVEGAAPAGGEKIDWGKVRIPSQPWVGRVLIKAGRIQFSWPEKEFFLQTDALDLDLSFPGLSRNGRISLSNRGGKIELFGKTSSLDSLDLTAGFSRNSLRLEKLSLVTGQGELTGSGKWNNGSGSVLAESDFRGRIPAALFQGNNHGNDLGGYLAFRGRGKWEGEKWRINSSFPDTRLEWSGLGLLFRGGEVEVQPGNISFSDLRLGIYPADVSPAASDPEERIPLGELGVSGSFQLEDPHVFSGELKLSGLNVSEMIASFPGRKTEAARRYLDNVGAIQGDFRVHGSFPGGAIRLDSLSLQGDNDLNILSGVKGWELLSLQSGFSWNGQVFNLEKITIVSSSSRIEGQGSLTAPEKTDLELTADPFDLSGLGNLLGWEMAGTGQVKGQLSGTLSEPVFSGQVKLAQVRVGGVRLGTVSGDLSWNKGEGLNATRLEVRPPGSGGDLILVGRLGPEVFDLSLWGDGVALGEVFPGEKEITGLASGKVYLSGRLPELSGGGRIKIQEGTGLIAGTQVGFEALEASFTVEKGDVVLENLTVSQGGGRVSIKGRFNSQRREVDLAVKGEALDPERFPFWFKQLKKWGISASGPLEIQGRIKGRAGAEPDLQGEVGFKVRQVFLGSAAGEELTLDFLFRGREVEWRGQIPGLASRGLVVLGEGLPLNGTLEFSGLDLGPWLSRALETEGMKGKIRGTVSFSTRLSAPGSLTAAAEISSLSIGRTDYYLENREPIRIACGVTGWELGGLDFAAVSAVQKGEAGKTGSLTAQQRGENLEIAGDLDLYWIVPFWSGLKSGSGPVTFQMKIGKAGWGGQADLKKATFVLSYFPQKIEEVSGPLTFNQNEFKWENLSGKLGGGNFESAGSVFLSRPVLLDLSFRLRGVRLEIVPWLPMQVLGDLRLSGEARALTLSGNVEVAQAVVTREINFSLIAQSFHTRKYQPTAGGEEKPPLSFNVHIRSEKGIAVSNNYAEASLGGEVDLRGNLWNPELHGVLETNSGKIFFRDNTFALTSARIDFSESAPAAIGIDPLIEVSAETSKEDPKEAGKFIKVMLQSSGPLSDLKVALSSAPARDEADLVSFLAYGVFLEDLKGRGGGITAMEAGSLVVGKAIDTLEGKLARITRVDRVQIEPAFSESTNTTLPRLLMRKRLGEDLDLVYTTEIGGSLNRKFTANYHLADWFSWGLKWDNEESQSRYGNIGTDLRIRIPFQ
jgi:hypothetical protein